MRGKRLFIKASKEILSSVIPVLNADNLDIHIIWATANNIDETFCKKNKVNYIKTVWENEEDIIRLGLIQNDLILLFSEEETQDKILSDSKMLKIIDFLEEHFPSIHYIA